MLGRLFERPAKGLAANAEAGPAGPHKRVPINIVREHFAASIVLVLGTTLSATGCGPHGERTADSSGDLDQPAARRNSRGADQLGDLTMHRRANRVDPVKPHELAPSNNPGATIGVDAKITIVVRVVERW